METLPREPYLSDMIAAEDWAQRTGWTTPSR